jgi:hypothetical protein
MSTSDGAPATPPAGDRDALARALAAEGIAARVRADGRLALVDASPEHFAGRTARDTAVRLARTHGFSHVALVLAATEGPAAAPGGAGPAVGPAVGPAAGP